MNKKQMIITGIHLTITLASRGMLEYNNIPSWIPVAMCIPTGIFIFNLLRRMIPSK